MKSKYCQSQLGAGFLGTVQSGKHPHKLGISRCPWHVTTRPSYGKEEGAAVPEACGRTCP